MSGEELEKKYEPLLELGNVEPLNKIAKRANQIGILAQHSAVGRKKYPALLLRLSS